MVAMSAVARAGTITDGVAKPMSFTSWHGTANQYDRILAAGRVSSHNIGSAAVSYVADTPDSAIMVEYVRDHPAVPTKLPYVTPVHLAGKTYVYTQGKHLPDVIRPRMLAFMSPLINGGANPAKADGNDVQAVEGRLSNICSMEEITITPWIIKCVDEFITETLDQMDVSENSLLPVGVDVIRDRQFRPSQRLLLDQADVGDTRDRVAAFIKSECYMMINDPRIISTMPANLKRDFSRFIYPLQDKFKAVRWYAFGKTPREIESHLAVMLSRAQGCVETDFSRWDGRVNNVNRYLELRFLLRAFNWRYHGEIREAHKSHYNQRAKLGSVTYFTWWARLSGSVATALFNGVGNAFVTFCMHRRLGRAPGEAYIRIGIAGGDDGVAVIDSPNEAVQMVEIADELGHKIEANFRPRGSYVTFLSRDFGKNTWFGFPNSCTCLYRQLDKLHMAPNLKGLPVGLEAQSKAIQKAMSIVMTDSQTPILGDWAVRVMEIFLALDDEERSRYGYRANGPNTLSSWWSQYDSSVQFTNETEHWMYEKLEEELARHHVDLDCSHFFDHILNATSIDDMLAVPMIIPDMDPQAKGYGPIVVATGTENNLERTWMSYISPPDAPVHRKGKGSYWSYSYIHWKSALAKRQRGKKYVFGENTVGHGLPTSGARKLGVMLLDFVLRYDVDILVYVGAGSEAGKTTAADMALGLLEFTPVEVIHLIDPHLHTNHALPDAIVQHATKATPDLMRRIMRSHNGHKVVGLFSDIRTLTDGIPENENVRRDMSTQIELWKALEQPHGRGLVAETFDVPACLKHRALYGDDGEDFMVPIGDETSIVVQPWTRSITTEVRIHSPCYPGLAKWNSIEHEQTMLYYCCGRLANAFCFADQPPGFCPCQGTWEEHAKTCPFGTGCRCAFCLQERVYMYEHLGKIDPSHFQKILDRACKTIAQITIRSKSDAVIKRDRDRQSPEVQPPAAGAARAQMENAEKEEDGGTNVPPNNE
jgi:hypothetical protein